MGLAQGHREQQGSHLRPSATIKAIGNLNMTKMGQGLLA